MSITKNSFLVTSAAVSAALISYIYNPFILGPALGPEKIAVLGTFLYISYILSFPHHPISMTLTRFASHYNTLDDKPKLAALFLKSFSLLSLWGFIALVLLSFLSPAIENFLNLRSPLPILAAFVLAYAGLLRSAVWEPLQGLLRFRQYSIITVVEPVVRLATGYALLFAGFGVLGAMMGYVCGVFASILLSFFFMRDFLFKAKLEPLDHMELFKFSIPLWVYSVYLAIVMNIDGLLVKHYFEDQQAGIYVAALTLAKLMFVFILPIGGVSFSMICTDIASNKSGINTLFKGLGISLVGCSAIVLGAWLLPDFVVNLTYGKAFSEAARILPLACLAYVPICMIHIYSGYFFAIRHGSFLKGLIVGTILELILLFAYHGTLSSVIMCILAGGMLQCLLSLIFYMMERKRPDQISPKMGWKM